MKKGFTLIELLVVVLIIGILAAIALPQYTKAVERSRVAEALTMNKTVGESLQRAVLASGYPTKALGTDEVMEMLDIDLAGGKWNEDNGTYDTKNFSYQVRMEPGSVYVVAERINSGKGYVLQEWMQSSVGQWYRECYTQENDTGRAICKGLTSYNYVDSSY
ncbi:prepilin-type N-terminal cleavage/methylation domain-containing protein [Elusimicrobium posterum]|uniref:type IV pilin protein n=1 Tax=Elusimicrobium posterum TaxID=3116653 RepID=UPI003C747689